MKSMLIIFKRWALAFFYPRPLIGFFYLPRFLSHWYQYSRSDKLRKIKFSDLYPCLGDWSTHTPFDAHYFYQGAWLARRVDPGNNQHVDIGSSVLTISVLSAHIDTLFVDFRPLKTSLPGLTSVAGNILDLSFEDDSVPSLSCLHVIEHIGLGRYGDPLDAQGSVKAAHELQRIVSTGGSLYLSLPIGRERICFNAHRVHSPLTVKQMFSKMELVEFSYVDDAGQLHENKSLDDATHFEYGCGLFHFRKLPVLLND